MAFRKILILAATSILFLGGCAKQSNKEALRRTTARGTRGAVDGGTSVSTNVTAQIGAAGSVSAGSYDQNTFQNQVQSLISNMKNPDGSEVVACSVSGQAGQSTGVKLWASVQGLQVINPNGGNNTTVNGSTGKLLLEIADSCVGQTDATGNVLTAIPIDIEPGVPSYSVTGTISGNQADVVFQDDFGVIELNGTFNAQYFTGWVLYSNNSYWDGYAPGAAGYLGVFTIPTCGFFNCQ